MTSFTLHRVKENGKYLGNSEENHEINISKTQFVFGIFIILICKIIFQLCIEQILYLINSATHSDPYIHEDLKHKISSHLLLPHFTFPSTKCPLFPQSFILLLLNFFKSTNLCWPLWFLKFLCNIKFITLTILKCTV